MSENGENEKSKKKAEEEFLHVIDVDRILDETGLDLNGLCKLVNLDSQTINRWECKKSKSGGRPKYNAIVRMLRSGATVETLFGVDYKHNPKKENEPIKITDEDLSRALYRAAEILGKNDSSK